MRRLVRQLVALCLLAAGLVLVLPAGPAAAVPMFPGNLGDLRVTFDNTGLPGFNTGPAALGVGAFRMDTGIGTGAGNGGKVFIHSRELDGQPVTALTTFSFQYFIDPASGSSSTPYANLSVEGPLTDGRRTLATSAAPGVTGAFNTVTVPTGDSPGWVATGAPFSCDGTPVPAQFSLEEFVTICPGTNIVATSFGTLGGVSVVTGQSDGAGFVGWTGVIDDLRINASQYDLEPARFTVTPASPIALPNLDPQSVAFTLQASGWNTFPGIDTTGPVDLPIVGGYDMQVGFRATGATTVTGSAGSVPVATQVSQLSSPPPPIMFTLDVTAALIGSVASIAVDWVAPTGPPTPGVGVNATTTPATTLLELPVVPLPPPPAPIALGYTFAAADGGVFNFGMATFQGSLAGLPLVAPVVGIAHRPLSDGYWLVAEDGGVFALGDAPFLGSAAGAAGSAVVGIAPHPGGGGYWVVTDQGQVLGFGASADFGDASGLTLEAPIVGIAATASGQGYWLFASDGGVFSYGDAGFFGSAGGIDLVQPIVGGAAAPDGSGYYLAASDGGVFTFGSGAHFAGSAAALPLVQPVVGMTADPDGQGYWLVAGDGGVFSFAAPFLGGAGHLALTQPIVAIDAL